MTVQDNRRRFINALRENAYGLKQHFNGSMYREENGEVTVCALGLLCYEFGIDLAVYQGIVDVGAEYDPEKDPYNEIMLLLNLDDSAMSDVWYANDIHKMSFSQIADVMEDKWFPVTLEASDITEIR